MDEIYNEIAEEKQEKKKPKSKVFNKDKKVTCPDCQGEQFFTRKDQWVCNNCGKIFDK